MRSLILGLLIACAAEATPSVVQRHGGATNCFNTTTTTCASETLTASTAGNTLIFIATLNAGTQGTPTDAQGDTFTICSACAGSTAGSILNVFYATNVAGGTTSITSTIGTSNAGRGTMVYEFHSSLTGGTFRFDVGNNSSCATTNCTGQALTLNFTADIIIQIIICGGGGTATAITTYTNVTGFATGGGLAKTSAELVNTSSGTAPTWTNTGTGPYIGAIAMSEFAPGHTSISPIAVY